MNLVSVYATVRDKHGKIVPTLNQDDFSLQEDSRPGKIAFFARQSDLPLTLGLLVDTSLSQRRVLDEERDASYTFLDHMLREGKDTAFLIHFDHEVELLQDLTGSRDKLRAALKLLQTGQSDSNKSDGDDNDGGQRRGGFRSGTQLYDAVFLASNELMKKQKGRKAIFILSDGVDRGSKESLDDAIEAAERADTAIYSLYFAGEEDNGLGYDRGGGTGRSGGGWPGTGGGWPGSGGGGGGRPRGGGGSPRSEERPNGKKILDRLSTETGGRLFEISKKLPIDQAYAQAEEELRNQYSLGYAPDPANGSGYHTIKLAVNQKDMTIQARQGYYSDK